MIRNERGIALLLTLVVLVLLVALIVEFDYGTKINLITAANFRDDVRATYLAKAGVAAAQAVLKDDAKNHGAYDGLDEFWAQPFPPYPVGEGFASVEITDEAGKIDVNRLGDKVGTARDDTKAILTRLLKLLEMDPNLVDPIVEAIKNWVDLNPDRDCPEEFYYQRQNPPYHCKKAPMDTLSELLLVKDMTPEIYRKIRPYLTTVSMSSQPININTADLPVLQALDNDISLDFAMRIRDGRPYQDMSSFYTVTDAARIGIAGSLMRRQVGIKSSIFTVRSHGIMHDTEKIVTALIQRNGTQTKLLRWEIE